ncbi:ribonuclease H [Rhodococcus gordoniae]|uniref:Ribonuclease H n=1 Tax=Rhodococcus gordoniae TaxID=223392 RepID=A0A379M0D7_9NOCA|nr:RNase H family protein [Rhodococcus gordoniae]SUE15761.1 ribonuclease H [Rhodococcus gordoniae]
MLAAIHIRQTHSDAGPQICAAIATDEDVALLTRDGDSETDRLLLGLDAFDALYAKAQASPARVHISDGMLRRTLKNVAESFPAVQFVDTAFGPFGVLLTRASATIGAHVAALLAADEARREAELEARPPLVVATDASKARNRRGTGLGCVSNAGVHHMRMACDARSILEGELLAIDMAVARFLHPKLHILTDSRLALACIEGTYEGRPEIADVVERIRNRIKGRTVEFSWVRGHSGHPLNEVADRLAVAARRCHDANVSPEVASTIANNIVASMKNPLPETA